MDGKNFMIALETSSFLSGKLSFNMTTYSIYQLSSSISQISTEKCTVNHFQSLPNINHEFSRRNMSNWDCFPINTSIKMGQDSSSSYVRILFNCSTCSFSNIAQVNVHTLTPNINPGSHNYFNYRISSNKLIL